MAVINKQKFYNELGDYLMIAVGMLIISVGWIIFLLPNNITTGGVAGLASIIEWGLHIPAQYSNFAINIVLLSVALKVLGLKFCIKTVYAVSTMTLFVMLIRWFIPHPTVFHNEPFVASIIGTVFVGIGIGIGLVHNGSTGGSDVVAAIINKYRDISLGRILLLTDWGIVSMSYFVLHDWEKVLYGYVGLSISSFVVDQVVNSNRRSVQFLIISERYEELCQRINATPPFRGCTVIDAMGYYSQQHLKMVLVVTKQRESSYMFRLINEIDPHAFVSQSSVIGVYGNGFEKFKVKSKKKGDLQQSTNNMTSQYGIDNREIQYQTTFEQREDIVQKKKKQPAKEDNTATLQNK